MANQNVNININPLVVFAPIIAAELTNAFYLAELCHAQAGVPPEPSEIVKEVMDRWALLSGMKCTPVFGQIRLELSDRI